MSHQFDVYFNSKTERRNELMPDKVDLVVISETKFKDRGNKKHVNNTIFEVESK